ncbi:hypothetical protein [Halarchaeum sp. P4]|uniref:hypothetical protein n=1 Tax=Halarchaeum sp. P4 TaxID=3421639 RepID=UPI003EBF9A26
MSRSDDGQGESGGSSLTWKIDTDGDAASEIIGKGKGWGIPGIVVLGTLALDFVFNGGQVTLSIVDAVLSAVT